MSLALPAFGQKAAMESKLAGFGRSFCADIDAMIGKKLTCEGGRPRRRFNFRWFLTYPVSDRPNHFAPFPAVFAKQQSEVVGKAGISRHKP